MSTSAKSSEPHWGHSNAPAESALLLLFFLLMPSRTDRSLGEKELLQVLTGEAPDNLRRRQVLMAPCGYGLGAPSQAPRGGADTPSLRGWGN